MPSPHPPEFRRRAVELARQGDKPLVQLAKDLGISRSCLQNRVSQADADDGQSGESGRLTSTEKKELAELRRRNRQLETENEIFKRAAAYFARENVFPK
ncbi:Transposase and inactivated derivatives [Thermomonospora echinospora]|uniref:Transposase and inactivated derivatives n=1 Tax=Thermomonospora echinospora TaxID=1992 RepID=A0A1H6E5C0_9ACTN|nr:transposase [Thermomonospora echinospora]SEG92827.1 Transposase and inactivated derivatives [Thermomonospora echinospora]